MNYREDFADAIGNTPLIKLKKARRYWLHTLGKAEFLNPWRFGEGPSREVHNRMRRNGATFNRWCHR